MSNYGINRTVFENVRIIYPDFTGTGELNKYGQPFFNIIVSPEEAELMASSALKIKFTKPSVQFPDPEPYVKVLMGYSFLNKETGLLEPSKNPPLITLHDIVKGKDIPITADNLDVLASSRLSNINIAVSQSTPKIQQKGPDAGLPISNFYLRSMTADVTQFYRRKT